MSYAAGYGAMEISCFAASRAGEAGTDQLPAPRVQERERDDPESAVRGMLPAIPAKRKVNDATGAGPDTCQRLQEAVFSFAAIPTGGRFRTRTTGHNAEHHSQEAPL